MQTGVITQENFSQILRGISQRRKQGTLEVHCGHVVMKVLFSSGRVVEVVHAGKPPVAEFAERLRNAGMIPEGEWSASITTYDELLQEGSKRSEDLTPELFAFALRHRVLDHLYELNVQEGSYYSFHIEMVNFEREHAPSISIGQLLLDLVAYYEERARFQEANPPGTVYYRGDAPEGAMSAEEDRVAWLIDGKRTLEDLKRLSLVSSFHFQEAVADLVRRGVIRTGAPAESKGADLFSDDLFSTLDDSIDSAFSEVAAPATTPAAVDQPKAAPLVTQPAARPVPATPAAAPTPAVAVGPKQPTVPAIERLNRWVLSREWIPHLMVAGLVLASVIIPFFVWGDIFWRFSGR